MYRDSLLTKNSTQLNKLPNTRNCPRLAQVRMPNDSFGDSLSLVFRSSALSQEAQSLEAAVKFEGHACTFKVGFSGADVVE
jgi:hypothetical protein